MELVDQAGEGRNALTPNGELFRKTLVNTVFPLIEPPQLEPPPIEPQGKTGWKQ